MPDPVLKAVRTNTWGLILMVLVPVIIILVAVLIRLST